MKVLLYFESSDKMKTSGIGRAMRHQMQALTSAGVDFTIDPDDDFDLAHINTLMGKSERLLNKCRRLGIPAIVHGHSTIEDFRHSFAFWPLIALWFNRQIRYMYKHAGLIITPTPYSRKLIESYNLGPEVVAVSNGINIEEYVHDATKIAAFKKHFDITDERVVIGIGYPFERKGIHDFFNVARCFPEVKFIWFGHLPKIATTCKIRRAIRHRPDNVTMPGYIDNAVIKGAMQYASCLFFPSYEETEGIVVLEALASYCPLLVRRIGVYEGWLEEEKHALMASSNEEFATKLKVLLAEDMAEMTRAGFEVVKQRTLEIIGQQLKETYEQYYAN